MQTKIVRRLAIKDVIIASLYGIGLTLALGLPHYRLDPPEKSDLVMAIHTGYSEVDQTLWSTWQTNQGEEIICPPGQSGFSIRHGGTLESLVCGFSSEETTNRCPAQSKSSSTNPSTTLRVCETESASQEYYSSLGWEAPKSFSACCPVGQKALCRFSSINSTLYAEVQCSG